MSDKMNQTPLEEVWLLTCSPHGKRTEERVFANMGEEEINSIAEQIAGEYNGFRTAITNHIKAYIKEELAKGETEIHIDDEVEEFTEFIIIKTTFDTGSDWSGTSEVDELPEEERQEVFRGSTIYATQAYYGGVDALYSAPTEYTTLEFEVE